LVGSQQVAEVDMVKVEIVVEEPGQALVVDHLGEASEAEVQLRAEQEVLLEQEVWEELAVRAE
jgi:hypothetical protein